MKFKVILLLFFSTLFCANQELLDNYEKAGNSQIIEAYMPDLDFYIFRGSGGFDTNDGSEPDVFLKRMFADSEESIHNFQTQADMAFYKSRIRVFYIKTDATVTDTDFEKTLIDKTYFTLTDSTGTEDKGRVYVDDDPIRVFMAYRIDTENVNVSGKATVGSASCMGSESCRKGYGVSVGGNYSTTLANVKIVLSHELGHYFGLWHPWDLGSCQYAAQGTTKRIMDYVSNPSEFITCERNIYRQLSQIYQGQKTTYEKIPGIEPDIDNVGPVEQYSTVKEGNIQVNGQDALFQSFDGTWQGYQIIGEHEPPVDDEYRQQRVFMH